MVGGVCGCAPDVVVVNHVWWWLWGMAGSPHLDVGITSSRWQVAEGRAAFTSTEFASHEFDISTTTSTIATPFNNKLETPLVC
jgi:hypothetical protein